MVDLYSGKFILKNLDKPEKFGFQNGYTEEIKNFIRKVVSGISELDNLVDGKWFVCPTTDPYMNSLALDWDGSVLTNDFDKVLHLGYYPTDESSSDITFTMYAAFNTLYSVNVRGMVGEYDYADLIGFLERPGLEYATAGITLEDWQSLDKVLESGISSYSKYLANKSVKELARV